MKNSLISISVMLTVLFFNGCQSFPPPVIKSGYYVNKEYKYSFKIPDTWKASFELPAQYPYDPYFQLYLSNSKYYGAEMMIKGKTSWIDYKTFDDNVVLNAACDSSIEEMREQWKKWKGKIEFIDCSVLSSGWEINAIVINPDKVRLKQRGTVMLYPKDEDDTYINSVILSVPEKNFNDSLIDYAGIIQSIRARGMPTELSP